MIYFDVKRIFGITRFLALTAVLALVLMCDAGAQTTPQINVVGGTCAEEKAGIYNAANDFLENAAPGSYLIIVGGPMIGEKPAYNVRRLEQVVELITWGDKTKADRFVTAIGTANQEGGYLKFYINGILSTEIRTRQNANLCWCEGDEIDFRRRKK